MHYVFPCRCKTPFSLLLLAALLLTLLILQQLVPISQPWPESHIQNQVRLKLHVTRTGTGVAGKLGFQIHAPIHLVKASTATPNHRCLPGFYSSDDLKPYMERPPQDPTAAGADGKAFLSRKMSAKEVKEMQAGMKKNCFNQFASDRISVHRSLGKDTRHPEFRLCPTLPTTSVIIVFHNEAWSTLLRTVYSVLHTAPAALLTEILLVDDASTADHLRAHLEEHVRLLKMVRVLRQVERKGLIAARLLGAREARGDVLTFLDAHCECFYGWLEPLLARIAEEPTAVVSPEITVINKGNFQFRKPVATRHSYNRGIFHWDLTFGWEAVPEHLNRRRKDETFPIKTPTIAGGLFSIKKSYFEQLGRYDDKMEIWGGENLEMSFRVWLCGGQLEIVPCSVVGHVFRNKSPYTFPKGALIIARNQVRLAEVWMDDYKKLFYRRHKSAATIARENNFGDISERLKLRNTLRCKNFSWYLENIYPEAFVPEFNPFKYGSIKNLGSGRCVTVARVTPRQNGLIMLPCHNEGLSQYFEHTSHKELRHNLKDQLCLHAATGQEPVRAEHCHFTGQGSHVALRQVWSFTSEQLLFNRFSNQCLTTWDNMLKMDTCDASDLNQHWTF